MFCFTVFAGSVIDAQAASNGGVHLSALVQHCCCPHAWAGFCFVARDHVCYSQRHSAYATTADLPGDFSLFAEIEACAALWKLLRGDSGA